jgi:group I intron endonuclease
MFTIYLIQNTDDGKVYVGQTSRDPGVRWKEHINHAHQGRGTYLYSAMRKHGSNMFDLRYLAQTDSKTQADDMERLWIVALDACNKTVGYNLTYSGNVTLPTPETRAKLSKSLKGKRPWNLGVAASPLTRQRMSDSSQHKSTPHSEEQKAAWSAMRKGKPRSDESVLRQKATWIVKRMEAA